MVIRAGGNAAFEGYSGGDAEPYLLLPRTLQLYGKQNSWMDKEPKENFISISTIECRTDTFLKESNSS